MRTENPKSYHESLNAALLTAQKSSFTRRGLFSRSAKIAAGGAVAALAGPAVFGYRSAMAQAFAGPVDVLNYALTLEHLENAFYRDFNATFGDSDFTAAGFGENVYGRFQSIGAHESAHVVALVDTINSLGGTPVGEAMYDFGVTDVASYVATAQVLENLGVGAYTGAAQFLIEEDALLTAALTIHGVEARHASYLNLINGDVPFPNAFEPALTPEEVLAAAGPLIVGSMPDTGDGSSLD
ncbi:MAG: ferritin-like domain-containing protein [Chloroflexia bacterium]|nr:ferritin-like domain-containing protein [Chloroflexia bacterium]